MKDHIIKILENMDQLFTEDWHLPDTSGSRKAHTTNSETDTEYSLEIELPGVTKKDIHITTTIQGIELKVVQKEEKQEENHKKGTYHFHKSFSGMHKTLDFPEDADLEQIDADYTNGILSIKVKKKKLTVKTKEIQIQ